MPAIFGRRIDDPRRLDFGFGEQRCLTAQAVGVGATTSLGGAKCLPQHDCSSRSVMDVVLSSKRGSDFEGGRFARLLGSEPIVVVSTVEDTTFAVELIV